jgi:hypothetical protein
MVAMQYEDQSLVRIEELFEQSVLVVPQSILLGLRVGLD